MVSWLMVGLTVINTCQNKYFHLLMEISKVGLGFGAYLKRSMTMIPGGEAEVKFQYIDRPQLSRGACISSCKRLKIAVNGFKV